MDKYKSIEYVPPDHQSVDDNGVPVSIDLGQLCEISQGADMLPLTQDVILTHPLGVVATGVVQFEGLLTHEPLAYAAVTTFVEESGDTLAVVGGVVTEPTVRGNGLAHFTIKALLENAMSDAFIAANGHVGFMARCNDASEQVFADLGFVSDGIDGDRTIMVKYIGDENEIVSSGFVSLIA